MSYHDRSRAPRGNDDYIEEGTGTVTSDSLAAESIRNSDSGFGSNQSHVAASGVPSRGTTANNTDTSGATRLPEAEYNSARLPKSTSDDYETPAAESNRAARAGETYESVGFPGGRTAPKGHVYDTSRGGPQESYAGDAPSYTSTRHLTEEQAKPKGKHLQEGGFDSDAPNASFNTEIGSRKDPGRLAEESFERENARNAADAGYPRSRNADGGDDKGGFENLDETSA